MKQGVRNETVARRFWAVVEDLLINGNQAVENAVWVSLIEWFAHGNRREKEALVKADA